MSRSSPPQSSTETGYWISSLLHQPSNQSISFETGIPAVFHSSGEAKAALIVVDFSFNEELRPHPPSVQGPDGLVWAGQQWPEVEILILRIHNRKRFGSTETGSVQPKPLRFNPNRFGSSETASVQPKPLRLNRNRFG